MLAELVIRSLIVRSEGIEGWIRDSEATNGAWQWPGSLSLGGGTDPCVVAQLWQTPHPHGTRWSDP